MISGVVRTEQCTPQSKEVFWMIDDCRDRLEDGNSLKSDTFSFGGQKWRVLLTPVDIVGFQYIDVSISRETQYGPPSPDSSSCVVWRAGILDSQGDIQYARRGLVNPDSTRDSGWVPVADWSGPEWAYISSKRDLYMPDNRLTIAIQLRWESGWSSVDDRATKTKSSTTKENTQCYKKVIWMIFDLPRRLEECDTILRDFVSFGSQHWHLLIQTVESKDGLYLIVSLSALNDFSETPTWWHAGILDKDEVFHYDRSGWVELDSCVGWTRVNKWTGPKCIDMFENRDRLIYADRLTVSVVLCKHGPLFAENEGKNLDDLAFKDLDVEQAVDPKKNFTVSRNVIAYVRDKVFHFHRSILEVFSPVMYAMLQPKVTDWQKEVLYLPDCDPEVFGIFLSYASSGDIEELPDYTIEKLYKMADTYGIEEIKKECIRRQVRDQEEKDSELMKKATESLLTDL